MKDPLDAGRTQEIPFPPEATEGEKVVISGLGADKDGEYVVEGPKFESTLTTEQLEETLEQLGQRVFNERYTRLGKMVNCPVHGWRHRQFEFDEKGCQQRFSFTVGGREKGGVNQYTQYREEEQANGEVEVTPDYRTAVPQNSKPTMKQIVGAAAFAKKRFRPHLSAVKLLFVERTREVFEKEGFYLLDVTSEKFRALTPEVQKQTQKNFQEDLQRARVIAARQIRRERELGDREVRRRQDQSRRINRGLKITERV